MKTNLLVVINTKFNVNRRKEFLLLFLSDYEVHICCPQNNKITDENKFTYHYSKFLAGNSQSIFQDIRFAGELLKLKNKINPDVVLSFTIKPIIYSSFIFHKSFIISTFTGLGYSFEKHNITTFIAKLLLKFSSLFINEVVVQNLDDKIKLEKLLRRKINLVSGSGIDFNNFNVPNINKKFHKTVLVVGRLIKAKGFSILLENLEELTKVLKSFKINLIIIGDYEKDNPDSITINDYNLIKSTDNITYKENTENIEHYYKISDFILTLSNREGLNRVNIEGMYFGLGVITLSNPGCHEMLINSPINLKMNIFNIQKINNFLKAYYSFTEKEILFHRVLNSKHITNNYSSLVVFNQYKKIIKR
tara:strand:- start:1577 stop:2662 length:1086 start_codon:yes stop_codon:yes gene_type:complete